MNQIAIGDSSGWTVIEGQSIAPPFKKSAAFFSFNPDPTVREYLQIKLSGTPAQISAAIGTLETIALRAQAYEMGEYAEPQLFRFQPAAGGDYYYAQISDLNLAGNPDGYITHQRGSYLIELHYNRPNWFDGDQEELPLTGRSGEDLTGGFTLFNHTDVDAPHGSTALIKAVNAGGDLPGPIRIELLNDYGTGMIKDLYFGIYHHPSVDDENIFFYNAPDMTGGTQSMNVNAIQSYYRSKTWTAATWTALYAIPLDLTEVRDLDGRNFRPFLHLFSSHAYTDLYLKIILKIGSYTLQTCEFVYADPDYDYVLFPPVQMPPKQILRENDPHSIDLYLYGLKEDGAAATLAVDQICLFPLDYAATLLGFFYMDEDDRLIYDNYRGLSNVRYAAGQTETIAHCVQGGPLLLYPGEYSRLFTFLANTSNTIDIMRTSELRLYYRPRVRLL